MFDEFPRKAFKCLRSSIALPYSEKLALLYEFLGIFSRLGDVESQLVVRYEILSIHHDKHNRMTEAHGGLSLRNEWIRFAEDCLTAGFPGNACKALGKANSQILCSRYSAGFSNMSSINDFVNVSESFRRSCKAENDDKKSTVLARFNQGLKRKEKRKFEMLCAENAKRLSFSL
ncbi:hypothetical protein KP509_24G008100 [Ceratopteris richardii]|uniref:Uncharacterized protein n=1 Tax=Ceratopteris richardii TaxID=49495 RepID=A0A8T2RUF0_CERRI|nr:hypothetical protein KP509_24G008100 [Ceratopteris richardii]